MQPHWYTDEFGSIQAILFKYWLSSQMFFSKKKKRKREAFITNRKHFKNILFNSYWCSCNVNAVPFWGSAFPLVVTHENINLLVLIFTLLLRKYLSYADEIRKVFRKSEHAAVGYEDDVLVASVTFKKRNIQELFFLYLHLQSSTGRHLCSTLWKHEEFVYL